jgi:hypothetical protein
VDVRSGGVLTVDVPSTAQFDAVHELDPATVVAVVFDENGQVVSGSEVAGVRSDVKDHGANQRVSFQFSVPDLVAGAHAPLTAFSASLSFRGRTFDGMCVEGSDTVRIVPSSHH